MFRVADVNSGISLFSLQKLCLLCMKRKYSVLKAVGNSLPLFQMLAPGLDSSPEAGGQKQDRESLP